MQSTEIVNPILNIKVCLLYRGTPLSAMTLSEQEELGIVGNIDQCGNRMFEDNQQLPTIKAPRMATELHTILSEDRKMFAAKVYVKLCILEVYRSHIAS